MSDDKLAAFFPTTKTFTTEFRGVKYDYYLTGNIGKEEDYLDLCNILRTASSDDQVVIHISSGGGYTSTGNMIINAINESQANVVGYIESDCGSMATFIFLACHTWAVSESAEFFCHCMSYGSYGKEHENFAQAEFYRKQSHKFIRMRYAGFLDDGEIERVIKGEDIFLDAEEIMERLEFFAELRDSETCEDENCTNCNQEDSPSIDEIVEAAVTRALEAHTKKQAAAIKKTAAKLKPAKEIIE